MTEKWILEAAKDCAALADIAVQNIKERLRKVGGETGLTTTEYDYLEGHFRDAIERSFFKDVKIGEMRGN